MNVSLTQASKNMVTDRQAERQTEIIFYFSMVKRLAQRPTDISAVAAILIIIKTFA